ncbi:hypothetical protein L6452_33472 [Arctium lappa]|uniref:Uncharacterized protein n=1 Tax=Arctium lappa TaxID=4217 RepID=A0ACB8YGM3_ARCLA|nr:hypothetical protein L6452_33472 [Arctium lappa]
MGCSESKIKNVEIVNRCKQRKAFMKQSISAHNAFAAAHLAYAAALRNTGAALSDYAQGELRFLDHLHSTSTTTRNHPPLPPHLPYDSLPPPPHPDSSDFKPHSNSIADEVDHEDDEVEDDGIKHRSRYRSSVGGIMKGEMQKEKLPPPRSAPWPPPPPPPTPPLPQPPENDKISSWDFFSSLMKDMSGRSLAEDDEGSRNERPKISRKISENQREHDGGGEIRTGHGGYSATVEENEEEPPPSAMKGGVQNVMLLQVFKELDDCFMKASKSSHEVSKILEANRLHYCSNFAYNQGHINHSTRVMRVITWNKSFKGPQIADDSKYGLTSKENDQTHATVLDKMLAWEKKLYDEVKLLGDAQQACEDMKYEYQKKIDSLNKLRKRGASSDSLERIKAMVSHLHTRCIVNMQSMDSTVSEINRLRDEQLYPKLVQLIEEMGIMWKNMQKQHESQSTIVQALTAIKISQSPKDETNEHNLKNTQKLRVHVEIWHSEFQKLMLHQNEFIKSLNDWLKLNLTDKISSPQNPKIQSFLRTWQDQLEKLTEEGAKTAINTFAGELDAIVEYQSDEMKMKDRCEETRRKLTRKSRKFEEWCDKQIAKRTLTEEIVEDDDEVIGDRQMVVEALKRRLEEEEEEYRRRCFQVKEKTLMNLNSGLPEVFTAMSKFSRSCSRMYGTLQVNEKVL